MEFRQTSELETYIWRHTYISLIITKVLLKPWACMRSHRKLSTEKGRHLELSPEVLPYFTYQKEKEESSKRDQGKVTREVKRKEKLWSKRLSE